MPENTDKPSVPPVVDPKTLAAPKSPEMLLQEQVDAELAKLPSIEELQKQIEEAHAKADKLRKLQDIKANFGFDAKGKDKGGTKVFNLPKMPKSLGRITINGRNYEGPTRLTATMFAEYLSHYSNRLELEEKMRNGNSLEDKEMRAFQQVGRKPPRGTVSITRSGETQIF